MTIRIVDTDASEEKFISGGVMTPILPSMLNIFATS